MRINILVGLLFVSASVHAGESKLKRIVDFTVSSFARTSGTSREKTSQYPALFGPEFEFRGVPHLWAGFRSLVDGLFSGDLFLLAQQIKSGDVHEKRAALHEFFRHRDSLASDRVIEKMRLKHERICERTNDCRVEWDSANEHGRRAYTVRYDDGFWFTVKSDYSTLEVTAKAVTAAEFRKRKRILDKDIFGVARKLGMRPPRFLSSGHVNISATAFGEPRLLRNFLVDFANHSELATGVLANYPNNAAALAESAEKRALFKRLVERFDNREIDGEMFSRLVQNRVNKGYAKSDAINLSSYHLADEDLRRMEIRSLRAQRDADDFLKKIELFEARIDYLKNLPEDIKFIDREPVRDPKQSVENFHKYVSESGLKWSDYKGFLPWKYRGFKIDKQGVARPGLIRKCGDKLAFLLK